MGDKPLDNIGSQFRDLRKRTKRQRKRSEAIVDQTNRLIRASQATLDKTQETLKRVRKLLDD